MKECKRRCTHGKPLCVSLTHISHLETPDMKQRYRRGTTLSLAPTTPSQPFSSRASGTYSRVYSVSLFFLSALASAVATSQWHQSCAHPQLLELHRRASPLATGTRRGKHAVFPSPRHSKTNPQSIPPRPDLSEKEKHNTGVSRGEGVAGGKGSTGWTSGESEGVEVAMAHGIHQSSFFDIRIVRRSEFLPTSQRTRSPHCADVTAILRSWFCWLCAPPFWPSRP